MKKRRGFTLIELLAVIVILAIISLISIPMVINIVNKVRKSAFLDSAYGIIESAKLYYAESMLNGGMTEDKTFLFKGEIPEGLHYSGTSPKEGILIIKTDGSISFAFHNGNYCTSKGEKDDQIAISYYEKEKCMIPDAAKNPVITLKEEAEITLEAGAEYIEHGVIAQTVDGTILEYEIEITKDGEIVEKIDTNIIGTYMIIYKTTSNNKLATITRKVIIKAGNADKSGANKPELNGLIPIKWNGSSWIVADEENVAGENQWYDYDTQMWANGASVTEEYRNKEVGTIVPEEAVLAYFVWIPRYEYMYTNLGDNYAGGTQEQPGEIKVNFIGKNVTVASSSDYKIHPAFHFGGTEVSGIWVGKFETSAEEGSGCYTSPSVENCDNVNQIPKIKPNVNSLRYQKVSNQFATAQKFSNSENNYGISSSVDAHMMKNSEWGAVAYLSQSKYGKYGNNSYTGANKEVYQNKSVYRITGCSSGAPGGGSNLDYECQYTYEKSIEGTGASTTGTIYGVYDMSGGAHEYVMGVYRGSYASSTWGASTSGNYAGFIAAPEAKYYDEYKTDSVTTACNNTICYGHGLSETRGWYSDTPPSFITDGNPWVIRGANCGDTTNAGAFYFSSDNGNYGYGGNSFRIVLLH